MTTPPDWWDRLYDGTSTDTAARPGRVVRVTGRSGRLPDWRTGQTLNLDKDTPDTGQDTTPDTGQDTTPDTGQDTGRDSGQPDADTTSRPDEEPTDTADSAHSDRPDTDAPDTDTGQDGTPREDTGQDRTPDTPDGHHPRRTVLGRLTPAGRAPRAALADVLTSMRGRDRWLIYNGTAALAGSGWVLGTLTGFDLVTWGTTEAAYLAQQPTLATWDLADHYVLAAGLYVLDRKTRNAWPLVAWLCRIPTAALTTGLLLYAPGQL
ncbi:hypothetical protein RM572_00630 [Streptomyces sp. DSM 42041]|uniref:DUF2834 domain-containing protein n=1 Tax=Streptomyces hazeniae TaxID=3075538 RepID=A0ABU2NJW0_9ACTN|nr:hypothetical protein [Streptomyces sp. DSM 42041]MDT0377281.1 hypothetical protein [Streptomyces sp. DSM 42041]